MKTSRNIPKFRFDGFTNDWEQRKLGSIFEEFSKKSKEENEYPVLSSTNIGMEHREGRVSGKSNVGYKIIETGDLVLSPQNLWLGNININNLGTGLVSPSYKTYKIRELISDFIRPQLKTDRMIAEYKYASTQGASVVRRNLDLDRFNNIQIRIPSTVEQQSIGSFFSTLDHLITLQQRELDHLKETKKTMLSELFPKKSETIPGVRFDGFTDAWEQRNFSNAIDLTISNNTLSRAALTYEDGVIKNIHYGDILVKFESILDINDDIVPFVTNGKVTEFKTQLLKNGDVILADSAEDETVGKAIEITGISSDSFAVAGLHTIIGRPKIQFAPKFLGYYLNSPSYRKQLIKLMQGIKVLSLSKKNIANTKIVFPKSVTEQQSIGSFFSTLDYLITLQQRKLDLLKSQKQTLLKSMFPR